MKRKTLLLIAMIVLFALLTACGSSAAEKPSAPAPAAESSAPEPAAEVEEASQPEEAPAAAENMSAEFPVPDDVKSTMDMGGGAINFQTTLSLPDVVSFYRFAFIDSGYVEREILTSVEDSAFNIVFDGHPSGKAIVVQGVDLGNGSVNVNIRFEDI